jgi:hypothetical protein
MIASMRQKHCLGPDGGAAIITSAKTATGWAFDRFTDKDHRLAGFGLAAGDQEEVGHRDRLRWGNGLLVLLQVWPLSFLGFRFINHF